MYVVETKILLYLFTTCLADMDILQLYEDWNFNSGNYLFTTDTK